MRGEWGIWKGTDWFVTPERRDSRAEGLVRVSSQSVWLVPEDDGGVFLAGTLDAGTWNSRGGSEDMPWRGTTAEEIRSAQMLSEIRKRQGRERWRGLWAGRGCDPAALGDQDSGGGQAGAVDGRAGGIVSRPRWVQTIGEERTGAVAEVVWSGLGRRKDEASSPKCTEPAHIPARSRNHRYKRDLNSIFTVLR